MTGQRGATFFQKCFWMLVVCASSAAFACSGEVPKDAIEKTSTSTSPLVVDAMDPDHAGFPEVVPAWRSAKPGTTLAVADALSVDLRNYTKGAEIVGVTVVASGLDGRLVERPLGDVRTAPDSSTEFRLAVRDLPIQSQTSTAFAVLQVEIRRSDGTTVHASTAPLYYHFQRDYAEVVLHGADDVAQALNGGLLASDPMTVQGRFWDAQGNWVDAASVANAQSVRTGVTTVQEIPEDEIAMPSPTVTASVTTAAATTDLQICTTWRVQYIDSGLGEDVWPSSSWQDVPASFAFAVLSTTANVLVWSGNLDIYGCVPPGVSLPSGSLVLTQYSHGQNWGRITFDNYYMSNGTAYVVVIQSVFASPGTNTVRLHPTYNNDAVQAVAVTGQALVTHAGGLFYGLGGMGIVPGTYTIHTNEGCGAPVNPPTDSCYNASQQILHIGTTLVQNQPDSHWKFVIAHELGHYVQDRAMGSLKKTYDDAVTEELCNCNYDPLLYSNTAHCLQSREIVEAGELEGFGHAFATRTFNNTNQANATFNYYKPFQAQAGVNPTPPPVARTGYTAQKWMENHCTASGRGVEWDWLIFYNSVASEATTNYTTFPTLFNMYRRACGSTTSHCSSSTSTVSWSSLLLSGAAEYGGLDPRYLRFRDTGINNGVDN